MKRFYTLLKIEGMFALRCPDSLIFGVLMPIGILFLLNFIAGEQSVSNQGVIFLQGTLPSLITVGICATAFMGIPITFADYRDKKILKHYFVTPASPRLLLLVQAVIASLTAIFSACMITICSILFFDYHMEGNLLLFLIGYLLVLISMYGIGMIIAGISPSVKVTNVISSIVYFPMLFLSGATIPYELFPGFLQNIADVLPLTQGVKLLKNLSMGVLDQQTLWSSLILIIIAGLSYGIAIKVFRWE